MKSNVLLVEDDPLIAGVLADFLEAAGHQVETATEGAVGLRKLASRAFDLTVLDVILPGLSGPAFCQAARRLDYKGAILMITGLSNASDGPLTMKTGADDFMVKPFDPGEMVERVNTLLRKAGK